MWSSAATSGQFGQSRPIFMGSKNYVVPFDRNAFQFKNGRSIRYWEIQAELKTDGMYFLAQDSSKSDNLVDTLPKGLTEKHTLKERHKLMLNDINTSLRKAHMENYFVTVTIEPPENLRLIKKSSA